MRIGIGQHRQPERVEHFHGAHIDAAAVDTCGIEREEIQIVVRVQRIAIEFDITFDLQMLAGFEQRPGWRRQAHTADVEIRESCAALVEDVVDPRQDAFARLGIALFDVAIDNVVRQSVTFYDDDAFGLSERGAGREY